MSFFDIIRFGLPIIGFVLGAQRHEVFHVGWFLGALVGSAIGFIVGYAITFLCAVVLSLITGGPLFRPKKKGDDA
jgi:hypothetical protein